MREIKYLIKEIVKKENEIKILKERLKREILQLNNDNLEGNRLSANSFTVFFSNLNHVLSAEALDCKLQYKLIADKLVLSNDIRSTLDKIIKERKVSGVCLHPEVITMLRRLKRLI